MESQSSASMAKPPKTEYHRRYDITENLQSMIDSQNTFRKDGILTDLTLKSSGKHFPCHKVVLASASYYFKAALISGFKETHSGEIEFPHIDPDILQVVLEYIYGQEVTLEAANVFDLHAASHVLWVNGLINKTKVFMLTNFRECIEHQSFLHLSLPLLLEYIGDSRLEVRNEDEVYKAVMRWIRHDLPQRENATARLMAHVRLPYCTKSFLCNVILKEALINKYCQEKLRQAIAFHLVPSSIPTEEVKCIKPRLGSLTIGFTDESGIKYISMDDGSMLSVPGSDDLKCSMKEYKMADIPFSNCTSSYYVCASDTTVVMTGKRRCDHGPCENKCWTLDTLNRMWLCHPKQKNAMTKHHTFTSDGTIYTYPGKRSMQGFPDNELCMLRKHDNNWQVLDPNIPADGIHLVDANSKFLLSLCGNKWLLFDRSSNNWIPLNEPSDTFGWFFIKFIDQKLLAFGEGKHQLEYYWYNFTEETWTYAGLVEARCSGVNEDSRICNWRGNLVFTYSDGLALFNPNTGILRHFISFKDKCMVNFPIHKIFPIFIPD